MGILSQQNLSNACAVQAVNFKCLVSCINETYYDSVKVKPFSFALHEGIGGMEI